MTNDIRTIDRFDGTMAEIYGQFAENEQTGLKKGVYWSVLIRCNPIQYMDCKWSPMILIDWMPVDTLANTPAKVVAADCPGAEASFFITSHDAAPSWSIEINQTTGAPARVDYELAVDFEGLENENIKALPVIGSAPLARLEFVVPRDSIVPKPNSHEDARNVVAPFFAGIANWVDLPEEDADGWPVKNPQHYRFTPPPPTD